MTELQSFYICCFICLSIGVHGNPILLPSGAVNKIIGDTLMFTCTFTDSSTPTTVSWKKGADASFLVLDASDCSEFIGTLPSGYAKSCTYTSPYTYTLTTSALADSDDETWSCVIVDSASASHASIASAVVTVDAATTTVAPAPTPLVINFDIRCKRLTGSGKTFGAIGMTLFVAVVIKYFSKTITTCHPAVWEVSILIGYLCEIISLILTTAVVFCLVYTYWRGPALSGMIIGIIGLAISGIVVIRNVYQAKTRLDTVWIVFIVIGNILGIFGLALSVVVIYQVTSGLTTGWEVVVILGCIFESIALAINLAAVVFCHVRTLLKGEKNVNISDKHVLTASFKDRSVYSICLPLCIHWECEGIVILKQKVNENGENDETMHQSGYTTAYTYDKEGRVHTATLTIASVQREHAGKWEIDVKPSNRILQWPNTHTLVVSDDKTGPNTGAGNTTASADTSCWKKNSILPLCTGGDAAGPRSAGDGSSVTTGHREGARKPADTKEGKERNPDRAPKKAKKKKRRLPAIEDAGSAVSGQDIELNPVSGNKSSGRPLPLPQNTTQTTGKKLPPMEQSITELDEKKKKKKKRRSKEDEKDE